MLAAVRAVRRLLQAGAENREIGRMADHGFDAGEWSASYHDEAYCDEQRRVCRLVARRYGMDPDVLEDELYQYSNLENQAFMNSGI